MIAVWLLSKYIKYQVSFGEPHLAHIKFPILYVGEPYAIIRIQLVQNYHVAPVILSVYLEFNWKFLARSIHSNSPNMTLGLTDKPS